MKAKLRALALACALGSSVNAVPEGAPTTIVTIVIDDLGHYDTSVFNPSSPTPHLKSLAEGGVRLGRHYTYKYCASWCWIRFSNSKEEMECRDMMIGICVYFL